MIGIVLLWLFVGIGMFTTGYYFCKFAEILYNFIKHTNARNEDFRELTNKVYDLEEAVFTRWFNGIDFTKKSKTNKLEERIENLEAKSGRKRKK